MKKAVITSGGKQYLVSEGETVIINLIENSKKTIEFEPILVVDGDKVQVGAPNISGAKVTAEITEADKQGDKVLAIRYKSKKRVHKIRGHRQRQTHVKINKIS